MTDSSHVQLDREVCGVPADAVPLRDLAEQLGVSLRAIQKRVQSGALTAWTKHDARLGKPVQHALLQDALRFWPLRSGRESGANEGANRRDPGRPFEDVASDGGREGRDDGANPAGAPGGREVVPVAQYQVAIQGWGDARDALASLRADHAREVQRLSDQHRDARRWGRGALSLSLVVVAAAAWWTVRERGAVHSAESARQTAEERAGRIPLEHAVELAGVQQEAAQAREETAGERAARIEAEARADGLRAELERQERAAAAMGEAFGRILRGAE